MIFYGGDEDVYLVKASRSYRSYVDTEELDRGAGRWLTVLEQGTLTRRDWTYLALQYIFR
jgi:hypothetical protein